MPALARTRSPPYRDTACSVDSNVWSESSTFSERKVLLAGKHGPRRCIAYYETLRATVRFYLDEHAGLRVMPRDVKFASRKT